MNPASRVYQVIDKLHLNKNNQKPLFEVYYEILNVDDPFSLYSSLKVLANEVNKIEKILETSNKIEKYKNYIILLKQITTPYNLNIQKNQINSIVAQVHPILMVFADSFDNQQYGEMDISDKLEDIEKDLNSFIKKISNLNIDDEDKILYAKVALKLKESITLYNLGGIDELKASIKIFECITKDSKEASSLTAKLLLIIGTASATTGLVSFATGQTLPQLLGQG